MSAIAGSTSSVRVTWEAPSNEGRPPIVTYDVQYRTGGGDFTPWSHDGTDTSTIITDLSAGTSYEVQVKAWNMEDDSEWSPSGTGSPDADPANNAPVYTGGVRNFTVEENSAAGENIGAPVTATDPDRDSTGLQPRRDGRRFVLHRPGDRADTDQRAAEPRGEGQPLRDGEG